jgi:hypothetical protein
MKLSQALRKARTIREVSVGRSGVRRRAREGGAGCPSCLLGFSPGASPLSQTGPAKIRTPLRRRGTRLLLRDSAPIHQRSPVPHQLGRRLGRRGCSATAWSGLLPGGRPSPRLGGGWDTPSERLVLFCFPEARTAGACPTKKLREEGVSHPPPLSKLVSSPPGDARRSRRCRAGRCASAGLIRRCCPTCPSGRRRFRRRRGRGWCRR